MQLDSDIKTNIANLVESILKQYRNRNPFFLARELGIQYCFVNLNNEADAFSVRSSSEDRGTIYIDSNLGSYTKKILCAHELGHLCLHGNDDSNLFDGEINPTKEYEANYFAVCLLPQIAATEDLENMSVEELNDFIAYKVRPQNWMKSITDLI